MPASGGKKVLTARPLLCTLLLACAPFTLWSAQPAFQLTSPAFEDGGALPRKASNNIPGNARCVGDNVSPPLAWKNAPTGTRSFAIIIENPEGRGGLGSVHWVAYGIPPQITQFAEGEASRDSDHYVGGQNTLKTGHYSGPCTPAGRPQHYLFYIIATDLEPKALPPGLTLPELRDKLAKHALASTGLVGLFTHPD
jgi:Raf kinase inhibitor-like YbhB/YbcL family protein